MLKIPHRRTSDSSKVDSNWQAIELWAKGRLQVVSFSLAGTLSVSKSPGFVTPNPLTIKAFHLFLITAGTATSTFDLLKNGSSILSAQVNMASGVQWTRVVLPRPTAMVSVLDVITSRAPLPDYLQAQVVTAGTTAADLYCGAEYD